MAVELAVDQPARDDRAIVYTEGSRRVYRASALGSCIRALVAAGLGMEPAEPHEFMQRAAEFGAEHEAGILEWLERERGFRMLQRQVPVELSVGARYTLRGHVDALASTQGGSGFIVEVKTAGQERAERLVSALRSGPQTFVEAEPRYAFQVSVYMLRLKLPALYVVWPTLRHDGQLALAKSPELVMLEKPPLGWSDVIRRIEDAERWIAKGELPPCDRSDSYFCPFRYLCERRPAEQVAADRAVEIDAWASAYRAAQAQRDQAEALMRQAREKLLELAGSDSRLETQRYRVTVSRFSRTSYDFKAMEADPQVAAVIAPYRRETVVESVRVYERGEKA